MDDAPGWHRDPEPEDRERNLIGSGRTERVRPPDKAGSPRLPEHVPELQRALAAATADIDAVEDRLSTLFDRTEGTPRAGSSPVPAPLAERDRADEMIELSDEDDAADERHVVEEDRSHEEFAASPGPDDDDGAFAELDAALAAEEPQELKRGFFRRRSDTGHS